MSERLLNDWINSYMVYTEDSDPPRTYRLWTAVSVVAAALQRKCYIPWGGDKMFPNLYIILVGPSGCRKGTAMKPGQRMLRELQIPMAHEATTYQALIRRLRQVNATDITPEGAPQFHASMTVFSKEFTVFLGYQNRELMSALCDWYDCDDKWVYDTKQAGTDHIDGVWLNLIGGTTPELIQSSMPIDAIGGGLTSRIVFIYERKKDKLIYWPMETSEDKELYRKLVLDLEAIHMLSGEYKISEPFMEKWVSWRDHNEGNPPFENPRFDGYMERRPSHILKLSMVFSASRGGSLILEPQDLFRAVEYLEQVEIKMPLTFSGLGKSAMAGIISDVMKEVGARGEIDFGDLLNMFYQDADKAMMEKVVETMEAMGFVDVIIQKGGRHIIRYKKEDGEK